MSKINVLNESVYNLISAGEVVENPASVVKELVENAIDAGADEISVSIEDGGIKSIVVTDNGSGMEKEDLTKCILPHATSKISCAADLNVIGTLGFRGEALASIAAVSETTIKSRYFEADQGYFIAVKGGVVVDQNISPLAFGTQVSVKNLFYNTPARYAFLKSPKGEENNVTSVVTDLIFANPDVRFTYECDGKTVFSTTGGLFESICSVFGEETAEAMIPVSMEEKGYRLVGYTARPATSAIRNNRTRQIFIVNGRVIEDATLSAVVQNAYGEFLMKRTFPTVILDLVMPFDLVDVNVHPNKREVRFADKKVVNGIVYTAVKHAVESDAEQRQKDLFSVFHPEISTETEQKKEISEVPQTEEKEKTSVFSGGFYRPEPVSTAPAQEPVFSVKTDYSDDFSYLRQRLAAKKEESTLPVMKLSDSFVEEAPKYKVLGQLFDTYLVLEMGDDAVFIDQHATHERILYDRLIEQSKSEVVVQDLLLPYDYTVEPSDIAFFKGNLEQFDKLGFRVELHGDVLSVYSLPCILTNLDIGGFLSELIAYNKSFDELTSSSVIKDKIAKIACKRAIKGGDRLTEAQITYVLDYFFKNGVPLQCPHGRPTMVRMSKAELEKRFGRIV